MKYILKGVLQTDGDFYVDMDYFWNKDFPKNIIHEEGSEYYYIDYETESTYHIISFLEELIVSYRVGTHYWLVEDLYRFTKKILDSVTDNSIKSMESLMYGNYDGTEIVLKKVESK